MQFLFFIYRADVRSVQWLDTVAINVGLEMKGTYGGMPPILP